MSFMDRWNKDKKPQDTDEEVYKWADMGSIGYWELVPICPYCKAEISHENYPDYWEGWGEVQLDLNGCIAELTCPNYDDCGETIVMHFDFNRIEKLPEVISRNEGDG